MQDEEQREKDEETMMYKFAVINTAPKEPSTEGESAESGDQQPKGEFKFTIDDDEDDEKKDDEQQRFDDDVDDLLSDENASSFFLLFFCPWFWCQREEEDSFFP